MNPDLWRTGGGPCSVDYEAAGGCFWIVAIALAITFVTILFLVFA